MTSSNLFHFVYIERVRDEIRKRQHASSKNPQPKIIINNDGIYEVYSASNIGHNWENSPDCYASHHNGSELGDAGNQADADGCERREDYCAGGGKQQSYESCPPFQEFDQHPKRFDASSEDAKNSVLIVSVSGRL